MACQCLELTEAALVRESSNTRLGVSILLEARTGRTRHTVAIVTYKRDPKNREKPKGMIPTYCPFCGTAYEE